MAEQFRQLRWDGTETLPPNEPFRYSSDSVGAVAAAPDDVASMIRDTRREIGRLVREVSQLARSGQAGHHFWPAFLERVVRAMTADGAVVWRLGADGTAVLGRTGEAVDIALPTEQRQIHEALVREVADGKAPVLVPPTPDAAAGPVNPTSSVVALVPLDTPDDSAIVLEVFLPEGGGPAAERGFLRFAAQMADLAGEYVRDAVLARMEKSHQLSQRVATLSAGWSAAGSVALAAQDIAEAFTEFAECQRASVCLVRRDHVRLVAVSGVVAPDRTSSEGRAIERAARLALDGAAFWDDTARDGAEKTSAASSDPQADDDQRAADTGLQLLAALPLTVPAPRPAAPLRPVSQLGSTSESAVARESDRCGEVIAVVVLEHSEPMPWDRRRRTELWQIAELAARDLRRIQLEQSFPFFRRFRLGTAAGLHAAPRGLLMTAAAGVLLLLLGLVPLPLRVVAPATLRPVSSESVYAASDGVIAEVFVAHGEYVEAGAPLIRLVSPQLDRSEEDLVGEKAIVREQLRHVTRQSLEAGTSVAGERAKLANEQQVLQSRLDSLDRQLVSIRAEKDRLTIHSRQAGTVDAWDEEAIQVGRPVRRGQFFLRVVDTSGPWDAMAEIPQDRLDHLDALLAEDETIEVEVRARAFPDAPLPGRLERLGPAVVAGTEGLPVALSRVRLTAEDLPRVQPGASASVAIDCGKRPAAYVVFQDFVRKGVGWLRLWLL